MSSRPPTAPHGSVLSVLTAVAAFLAACGPAPEPEPGGPPRPREPDFDFAPGGAVADAELGDFHVVLECAVGGEPVGEMAFELWPRAAPRTVRRFLRHCDEGWLDGSRFWRIRREYVVQGGDRVGDGTGRSPYGTLPDEISLEPEYAHHYGVLSMADPPSMQFFVCVAESNHVWSLDHSGHNAFGRLARGVAALESLANVETGFQGSERSVPLVDVAVVRARAVRGPVEPREEVARPRPDLGGQPEIVGVRHVLVTFLERAGNLDVQRNRAEAEALARECYAKVRSGELSFAEAVESYSDESYPPGVLPPLWRMSNYGVYHEGQRVRVESLRQVAAYRSELAARVEAGEIDGSRMAELLREQAEELAEWVGASAVERREESGAPGYAEVAFELEVGEVGLVPYDRFECPGGYYVLLREE